MISQHGGGSDPTSSSLLLRDEVMQHLQFIYYSLCFSLYPLIHPIPSFLHSLHLPSIFPSLSYHHPLKDHRSFSYPLSEIILNCRRFKKIKKKLFFSNLYYLIYIGKKRGKVFKIVSGMVRHTNVGGGTMVEVLNSGKKKKEDYTEGGGV